MGKEKSNKPIVSLIEIGGLKGILDSAEMPYQTKSKNSVKLANRVMGYGHKSIARHSIVTFRVDNVSQSCLRQISRHPHINLTVKSSRYCDMSDVDYYIPNSFKNNKEAIKEYNEDMKIMLDIYKKWHNYEELVGLKDVSKMFLPLGSQTDLIISGNIQAMEDMLTTRVCIRTEEEFRYIALEMVKLLQHYDNRDKNDNSDEFIRLRFNNFGCKGKELGYCPEYKGCGLYPPKSEIKIVKNV